MSKQRKGISAWVVWLLFFVICVYSVLDVYQTSLLIERGANEANPLLIPLMRHDKDIMPIVGVKVFFLSLLAIFLALHNKKRQGKN